MRFNTFTATLGERQSLRDVSHINKFFPARRIKGRTNVDDQRFRYNMELAIETSFAALHFPGLRITRGCHVPRWRGNRQRTN
ncbi:hypothetical protein TNCV_323251 [Trichonephila clavipes]|nr:hypothetical protein TNCV_323251 [Trichonephila clavipes]